MKKATWLLCKKLDPTGHNHKKIALKWLFSKDEVQLDVSKFFGMQLEGRKISRPLRTDNPSIRNSSDG